MLKFHVFRLFTTKIESIHCEIGDKVSFSCSIQFSLKPKFKQKKFIGYGSISFIKVEESFSIC